MKCFFPLFCFTLFFLPAQLGAYEFSFTCGGLGEPCRNGERAKQVLWKKDCVSYYVNELGSSQFEGDSERFKEVIDTSFSVWNDAMPGIKAELAGETNIRESVALDGNVITWRDEGWPHASATALALTIIIFDPKTGEIVDADIEFNTAVHDFSLDEESMVGKSDFQSTLTHEIGHFFGLDHSQEREATMFASSKQGQSKKRTLHPDDLAGFSAAYPDTKEAVCDTVPDFLRGKVEEEGCCSTITSKSDKSGLILLLILSVLLLRPSRS